MSDRILMMRLMGCKFGLKKTERDYKVSPDDPKPIHEVTILGPSGRKFKMAVSDSAPKEPATSRRRGSSAIDGSLDRRLAVERQRVGTKVRLVHLDDVRRRTNRNRGRGDA